MFVPRPVGAHYLATREELSARADAVLGWIEEGVLDIRIGRRHPFAEAAEAHTGLTSRRTTGKLLLIPWPACGGPHRVVRAVARARDRVRSRAHGDTAPRDRRRGAPSSGKMLQTWVRLS
ncbi:zinc-binding dehydrogenase [Streptomyces sp. NPDC053720]|uniref:zinc-binding dehydrogenase n=1 Tax=Streptomyces sp. NPDC053720 TaxID=3154855 RepID=UPI00341D99A0